MVPRQQIKTFSLLLPLILVWSAANLSAQQINVGTPLTGASDSFFESFGVNFGFSIPGGQGPGSRVVGYNGFGVTPNIHFSQGGFGSAIPSFGGFSPNSGARFGFGNFSGGGGYTLGFHLAQGNSRFLGSTSPSVTVMNGGVGVINSGAFSPFVTGVIPVVGRSGGIDNAVTRGIASGQLQPYSERRLAESRSETQSSSQPKPSSSLSSAAVADISVAEIKANKAQAKVNREKKLKSSIKLAEQAQGKGDYRTARIELRKAIKLADDESQLRKLKNWMKTLRGK